MGYAASFRGNWFKNGLLHTVQYISTHLIHRKSCVCSSDIIVINVPAQFLFLYCQLILCCVQNLTHRTVPLYCTCTGIFDSVLNVTSNTTTAASDRLIQACIHMANTMHAIWLHIYMRIYAYICTYIYNVFDRQILTELVGKLQVLTDQGNCHTERIPRQRPQFPCLIVCIRYD